MNQDYSDGSWDGTEILDNNIKNSQLIINNAGSDNEDSDLFQKMQNNRNKALAANSSFNSSYMQARSNSERKSVQIPSNLPILKSDQKPDFNLPIAVKEQINFSQIEVAMQEDYDLFRCAVNPYISVEVSGPVWNNEGAISGSHRLFKIVTKLRDNPEFPFV